MLQHPKVEVMLSGNTQEVDETVVIGPYPHEKGGVEGMYDAEMLEVFNDAVLMYVYEKLKGSIRSKPLEISEGEFVQGVVAIVEKAETEASESKLHVHLVPPASERKVPKMFMEEREEISKEVLNQFIQEQAKLYFDVFAQTTENKDRGRSVR